MQLGTLIPAGMTFLVMTVVHSCRYSSSWMNYWWGYELVHKWMLTGKFTWDVPLLGRWLEWQYPGGKPPCDWFGVNYYSRCGQANTSTLTSTRWEGGSSSW